MARCSMAAVGLTLGPVTAPTDEIRRCFVMTAEESRLRIRNPPAIPPRKKTDIFSVVSLFFLATLFRL